MNHCTPGAQVSKESIPSFCRPPQAQKHALNFFTVPSGNLFILKAHVLGRTFISGKHLTRSQHLNSFIKVFNSTCMACQNSAWKGPIVAVSQVGLSSLYFVAEDQAARMHGSMTSDIYISSVSQVSIIMFE